MAAVVKVKRKKKPATALTPRRRRAVTAKAAPRRRRRTRKKGMAEGMMEGFSFTQGGMLQEVAEGAVVVFAAQKFVLDGVAERKTRIGYLVAGTVAAVAFKRRGAAVALATMAVIEFMTPATGTAEGVYFDPSLLNDGDEPLILDREGNVVMMSDGSSYQSANYQANY